MRQLHTVGEYFYFIFNSHFKIIINKNKAIFNENETKHQLWLYYYYIIPSHALFIQMIIIIIKMILIIITTITIIFCLICTHWKTKNDKLWNEYVFNLLFPFYDFFPQLRTKLFLC